jgi:hypothetical protein
MIYHCKHLVFALERLFEVTNELLIIETAILPLDKTPKSFTDAAGGPSVMLHPLVYAENLPECKEHVFNWFFPGLRALEALLKNVGFSEADVFSLKRDRAILLCRKTKSDFEGRVLSQSGARLTLQTAPDQCTPGSDFVMHVLIENSGTAAWLTETVGGERGIVRLGAHLLDENGEEVTWDYGRASLTRGLGPDESELVSIKLQAPITPGGYTVELDMVLEHITWFEDLGTQTIRHKLKVKA